MKTKCLIMTLAAALSPAAIRAQNLFTTVWFQSDSGLGGIYEFTTNGTSGLFVPQAANGLAFDGGGNLYAADHGSGSIYRFTPGGAGCAFATGLSYPAALAFDSASNLFVADGFAGNGFIYKYARDGGRSTFASGLSQPQAVAFDSFGNLFVADYEDENGAAIYKYAPGGGRSTFATALDAVGGLAFDHTGNLFVADWGGDPYAGVTGSILEFTTNGVRNTFASGELRALLSLAFDNSGNLYVGECSDGYHPPGGHIFQYAPDGSRSLVAASSEVEFFGYGPLAFQPIPKPGAQSSPPLLATLVSSNTLTFWWPLDYLNWEVQSNAGNLADAASWFLVSGSLTNASLTIPLDPARRNVFYRLHNPAGR